MVVCPLRMMIDVADIMSAVLVSSFVDVSQTAFALHARVFVMSVCVCVPSQDLIRACPRGERQLERSVDDWENSKSWECLHFRR